MWSCGITFWEATSYGAVPYAEIDNSVLVTILMYRYEHGQFLEKPDECPDEIYGIMKKCWELDKDKRIKFSELVIQIRTVAKELYGVNLQ